MDYMLTQATFLALQVRAHGLEKQSFLPVAHFRLKKTKSLPLTFSFSVNGTVIYKVSEQKKLIANLDPIFFP